MMHWVHKEESWPVCHCAFFFWLGLLSPLLLTSFLDRQAILLNG